MKGLESYNYNESSGFISHTMQINHHMDLFRDTNELAISANTEAVKEQTVRLEATISAQTIQQAYDAAQQRITITNVFNNLIKGIKKVFSKTDESGETEISYYEMIKSENDQTQAFMSAHTTMLKNESNETQAIMSANTIQTRDAITSQTQTTAEKLQNIVAQLNSIKAEIDESTSGNTVNANAIKEAISNLELKVTNNFSPNNIINS